MQEWAWIEFHVPATRWRQLSLTSRYCFIRERSSAWPTFVSIALVPTKRSHAPAVASTPSTAATNTTTNVNTASTSTTLSDHYIETNTTPFAINRLQNAEAWPLFDHLDGSLQGEYFAATVRGLQQWRRRLCICVSNFVRNRVLSCLKKLLPITHSYLRDWFELCSTPWDLAPIKPCSWS